jgi:hypothetical protein
MLSVIKDPMDKPATLCMAPWTHTYLSPQTERRMCCASREPAQNFAQYIDTAAGTGRYIPITLDDHWNSPHMRVCVAGCGPAKPCPSVRYAMKSY